MILSIVKIESFHCLFFTFAKAFIVLLIILFCNHLNYMINIQERDLLHAVQFSVCVDTYVAKINGIIYTLQWNLLSLLLHEDKKKLSCLQFININLLDMRINIEFGTKIKLFPTFVCMQLRCSTFVLLLANIFLFDI